MKMPICCLTPACPMYSASVFGRTVRARSSSSRVALAVVTRSCSIMGWMLPGRGLQCAADQLLGPGAFVVHALEQPRDFGGTVAEGDQCGKGLGLRARGLVRALRGRRQLAERADAVAHFDEQAL